MTEQLADQLRAATVLLESVASDRSLLASLTVDERTRLLTAAGDVFSPDVEQRRRQLKTQRRLQKADKVQRDQAVLADTGIRVLRSKPVFTTPNVFPPVRPGELDDAEADSRAESPQARSSATAAQPRHCYICKQNYIEIDDFYDQLCPTCAAFNFGKRSETTDLSGRVALLTGGRVKIGYQAGIKLLRAGATLIVTTRFPRDSALRYSREADAGDWMHRLQIFGLDLRHTPSVEEFCQHLTETTDRLDFIVNNACQTVRRPSEFYRHMMDLEAAALGETPTQVRALVGGYQGARGADIVRSAGVSQSIVPIDQLFPVGQLDQDLQQVDLRDRNSRRLTLAEVSSLEMLETQLVNAVAPFVLNARLKGLMTSSPERDKHIVNVSAVEGQFYRKLKTTRHPHTNMAKAALNMMTRTSAAEFHADGIHMNSVDTGWVSDEDPVHIAQRKTAQQHFHPPLDIVDGAARIVDPIIAGCATGNHVWGKFLKDYVPTDW